MRIASLLLLACFRATHGASSVTVSIASCEDLRAATEATETSDVLGEVSLQRIVCDEGTTFEVQNNRLKLVWVGEAIDDYVTFYNTRFVVSSGVLRFDMEALMDGSDVSVTRDVDGEVFNIAEGARVRFMERARFVDVAVTGSATREGGCIHNEGLIRFEKEVEMVGCWITEDGGTVEANGAGIWNGETGRVVVKGFLTMRNNLAMVASGSTDSKGGAVYNKGTFSAFGGAQFERNMAQMGGAIYNEGVLKFLKNTEPIDFVGGVRETGMGAGHVYNSGTMLFRSGAYLQDLALLQEDSDGGAVINRGTLRISDPAFIVNNQCQRYGGAIYTTSDAILDLPEDVVLDRNYVIGTYGPSDCDDIYVEGGDGYTCLP